MLVFGFMYFEVYVTVPTAVELFRNNYKGLTNFTYMATET
jgi:hypothetical protein